MGSMLTTEQKKSYLQSNSTKHKRGDSKQLHHILAPGQKKNDSGQLGNSLTSEQMRSDFGRLNNLATKQRTVSEQVNDTLVTKLKRYHSRRPNNNLTNQPESCDSGELSNNLATKHDRNYSGQLSNNQATEYTRNDSGQLGYSLIFPVFISANEQRKSYNSEQLSNNSEQEQDRNDSRQVRGNLATEHERNDSRQVRSNLATGQERNDSRQLRGNLATEHKRSDSRQVRGNLATEHERSDSRQLTDNLATEHEGNDSRQLTDNLATEQQSSESQQSISYLTSEQEKCYDPMDTTLIFVDRDDDLDFLCEDFKSLRALMSCGHAVTPMSLTKWCRLLLDQGECAFLCGIPHCNTEWSYKEVCRMALLNPEEKEYFEKKMFSNVKYSLDVKLCPGCKSCVMRDDLYDLSVTCTQCTKDRKHPYIFCWQCLKEWKGPAPRSDRCENDGCRNISLEILKTCPDITFQDVEGVTGCPPIRACPTCGQILEHNKMQCKNIFCPRCRVEFCFVCLKLTDECLETSEHFVQCSGGVAPRQTSIPVWEW